MGDGAGVAYCYRALVGRDLVDRTSRARDVNVRNPSVLTRYGHRLRGLEVDVVDRGDLVRHERGKDVLTYVAQVNPVGRAKHEPHKNSQGGRLFDTQRLAGEARRTAHPKDVGAGPRGHYIDLPDQDDISRSPLRRVEAVHVAVHLHTLLVVGSDTDDEQVGVVLLEQRLEVMGPVVKPRRHETRR